MVDETRYSKPSTSTGSYTTHDNETSSSDDEDDEGDVFHSNSQDESKDTQRLGSVSDEIVSGSESEDFVSEDEWDEDEDVTASSDEGATSSDEVGTASSGSDEDKK